MSYANRIDVDQHVVPPACFAARTFCRSSGRGRYQFQNIER
jgi:hypothetical protein